MFCLCGGHSIGRLRDRLRPGIEGPYGQTAAIHSAAVVPFRTVALGAGDARLAGDVTDTLISDLSRVKTIRVISHQSVRRNAGSTLSTPLIARQLNAEGVAEGAV